MDYSLQPFQRTSENFRFHALGWVSPLSPTAFVIMIETVSGACQCLKKPEAPRALTASRPVPINPTRISRPRDLTGLLVGRSIGYKSAVIATAPGSLLAYLLQVPWL